MATRLYCAFNLSAVPLELAPSVGEGIPLARRFRTAWFAFPDMAHFLLTYRMSTGSGPVTSFGRSAEQRVFAADRH
jgi:hypothetical protein